jgi:hypothetical protein
MPETLAEIQRLKEKVHELEIEIVILQTRVEAADKALELAKSVLEHTQAVSSEWRQESQTQRNLFMTSEKVRGLVAEEAILRRALEERVVALEQSNFMLEGKDSTYESIWLRGGGYCQLAYWTDRFTIPLHQKIVKPCS